MLFIIFFVIEILSVEINLEKVLLRMDLEIEEKILNPGKYKISGEIKIKNDSLGKIFRLSRIYYPCKAKKCKYLINAEIPLEKIKKEDLLNFLNRKEAYLDLIFHEIEKNISIKKTLKFETKITKEKDFLNVSKDLLKIENISLSLKEKPKVEFDLFIKNPFNFQIKIEKLNINFNLDEFNLKEEFEINETLNKGEKTYKFSINLKEEILLYILAKKFTERDITKKLKAKANGILKVSIENKFLEIPF